MKPIALVVDDEPHICELLSITLERMDIATRTCLDITSAKQALAEQAFDSLRRRDRVILTGRLRVRNWDSGDKRGTSVDIDVDAIGHELLFGTTTFAQDATAGASASSAPSDDAWAPVEGQSAGWNTAPLGSGMDGAQEATRSTPDSAESDGGEHKHLAPAGAETPF